MFCVTLFCNVVLCNVVFLYIFDHFAMKIDWEACQEDQVRRKPGVPVRFEWKSNSKWFYSNGHSVEKKRFRLTEAERWENILLALLFIFYCRSIDRWICEEIKKITSFLFKCFDCSVFTKKWSYFWCKKNLALKTTTRDKFHNNKNDCSFNFSECA